MQKSRINPEILQPMFEAASNAAEKGQSQFFTPIPFGQLLAKALPKYRLSVCDLNCGAGNLLHAAANRSTTHLFGADIDPCRRTAAGPSAATASPMPVTRITSSITQLYPLLKEAGFTTDLLVLNPPWRLLFYRKFFADLARSELQSVRAAYNALEPGISADTIDSTVAMLLVGLDLFTAYGEGFLIANNNTLDRLIFAPGAPHSALAKHIWARLVIPGNPMTGIDNCHWQDDQQFYTGVIYFARDHTTGPETWTWTKPFRTAAGPSAAASDLDPDSQPLPDRSYRQGAEIRNLYLANADEASAAWLAIREHLGELNGNKPKTPWNLWLENGSICTELSRFEQHSVKVNKKEVERLFALNGKTPMELVLQRNTRDQLTAVAERSGWRVQPTLLDAVRAAVQAYHAERAPLYPLPEIQRLGYLDEEDSVACKLDLMSGPLEPATCNLQPATIFHAGQHYPLRTQTVQVTRTVTRPNAFTGAEEELEYSGQELAIFITDKPIVPGQEDAPPPEDSKEFCFMDAKLKDDPDTKITTAKRQKRRRSPDEGEEQAVDFSLQQLCNHFVIPEVPDVATNNPEGYKANLHLLSQLETICS